MVKKMNLQVNTRWYEIISLVYNVLGMVSANLKTKIMKEAERILREIVGKDCIWEEMNNLTNTPIDLVVKAMEMYKNKALTIPVVVGQSEQLLCEDCNKTKRYLKFRVCEPCLIKGKYIAK